MTDMTQVESDIMTSEDVEREFKIKRGTQGAMRSRGQIPFHRLGSGKIIRYSRQELSEWFTLSTVPAVSARTLRVVGYDK